MMKFYPVLILTLGLTTIACDSTSSKHASPALKNATNSGDASKEQNHSGDGAADKDSGLAASDATIKSMTYDAEKHAIKLELAYSGCAKTEHQLIISDVCAESYPMQCSASLKRPKDFNASCQMILEEEVVLALPASFDTSVVSVESNGKRSNVLVDREGKTKDLGQ